MTEFLKDRERALEDSFFAKRDKELLAKLQQNLQKEQLGNASGISDDSVLDSLLAAN